jgi:hypothetical protein
MQLNVRRLRGDVDGLKVVARRHFRRWVANVHTHPQHVGIASFDRDIGVANVQNDCDFRSEPATDFPMIRAVLILFGQFRMDRRQRIVAIHRVVLGEYMSYRQ